LLRQRLFYFCCMNVILFDPPKARLQLLPLTFTRPVGALRVGIFTLQQKWQNALQVPVSFLTQDYLSQKFPVHIQDQNLLINGGLCPTPQLLEALQQLSPGAGLVQNGIVLAVNASAQTIKAAQQDLEAALFNINYTAFNSAATVVSQPWHIFQHNGAQIRADFDYLSANQNSHAIKDQATTVYGRQNIFIEEGVHIRAAVLNAEDGPIYLGKNAQVHEGALIKGPFALCEGSHVNMGGKMRGDTTVGPYSKVGGEISNSVIQGFSNKGHDGFLGNSVLGEWCNLGADTNTSNLKNNYANVKLWSYQKEGFVDSGSMFCGLIMADHAKCGINTMFNTGTVVGVSANVFGSGFPRNFIPSFSWGGAQGFSTYKLNKVYQTAELVMQRRKLALNEQEKAILQEVFEQTAAFRYWEKQ